MSRIERVSMGGFSLDMQVDDAGIITKADGDPRGAHYVGQNFGVFMNRRARKQLKYGAYRRAER